MKNIKFWFCLTLVYCLAIISIEAQTIFKTPKQAAQTLYGAWQKKNKKQALAAAQSEAVEKLFSVRRQKMVFKGCSKREEGDFECLYENRKLDLTMAMLLDATRRGYRVKSLSFSSEAL